jgi:hypothetical protein
MYTRIKAINKVGSDLSLTWADSARHTFTGTTPYGKQDSLHNLGVPVSHAPAAFMHGSRPQGHTPHYGNAQSLLSRTHTFSVSEAKIIYFLQYSVHFQAPITSSHPLT